MTALSLAPVGAVAQAGEYLRHGDIDNVEQLLRFLADTFLLEGYGFEAPREVPDLGVYVPGAGDVPAGAARSRGAIRPADGRRLLLPLAPAHGQHRLRRRRCAPRSRRPGATPSRSGATRCGATPTAACRRSSCSPGNVDALIVTMLATGGSSAGDAVVAEGGDGVGEAWQEWDASALTDLGVPVIQAVCATASRAAWQESDAGLAPLDAATQVAIPEFDGRLLGGVISFKERDAEGSRVGVAGAALRARPRALLEGCAAGRAHCAAAHAARRRAPRRGAAHELPDQAREGRHGGRPRHARERAEAVRRVRGRRHAGRAALRARRRAHARADRDGRPRRRVPDRRPARRLAAAAAGRGLPRVVRRAARVAARGDGGALGRGARRPLHRRRRLRRSRASSSATCSSRSSRRAATATIRSASTTTPSCRPRTTTSPATGGSTASGEPTRSCTSASTARSSGCPARRSRSRPSARPTPRSATSRSSTRSSSTTPARACRPSAACTP